MISTLFKKVFSSKAKSSNETLPATLALNGPSSSKGSTALLASNSPLNKPTPPARMRRADIPDQYAPLWQLFDQRQFLEVRIGDAISRYQTLILAIDVQRNILWLDDLFPNNYALDVGDEICISHHIKGLQLSFNAHIIAFADAYGAQGFAVELPQEISYQPRRQHRRAAMGDTAKFGAKIRPIGQEISYANILDVSAGGVRVSVAGNLLRQLRHGALLPLCELQLSEDFAIRCSARIKSFRLVRAPSRATQISLEFADLTPDSQAKLEQFINNMLYYSTQDERLTA